MLVQIKDYVPIIGKKQVIVMIGREFYKLKSFCRVSNIRTLKKDIEMLEKSFHISFLQEPK